MEDVGEVQKREEFKDVDLNGRKWRVEKLDALSASYMAYQILNYALPPMLSVALAQAGMSLGGAKTEGRPMSKDEFGEFQRELLRCCFERLPKGPVCVIGEDGDFGVIGLEKDAATVLGLTIHALVLNIKGFFNEGLLSALPINPLNLNRQDA